MPSFGYLGTTIGLVQTPHPDGGGPWPTPPGSPAATPVDHALLARRMWTTCDITLPDGVNPLDMSFRVGDHTVRAVHQHGAVFRIEIDVPLTTSAVVGSASGYNARPWNTTVVNARSMPFNGTLVWHVEGTAAMRIFLRQAAVEWAKPKSKAPAPEPV